MDPHLRDGQIVLFRRGRPSNTDTVLASTHKGEVVKRLFKVGRQYVLSGTGDSSTFIVGPDQIKGKMLVAFPRLTR